MYGVPFNNYPLPFNRIFPYALFHPIRLPLISSKLPDMKKFAFILILCVLFTTCEKKELGLAGNSTFSLDKFEQNIKNTYGPQTTGYSYAISQFDKVVRYGAGGNARLAADGLLAYTPETRQDLYSVTKFVTAVAVCK